MAAGEYVMLKKCTGCHQEQPEQCFAWIKSLGRLNTRCRQCVSNRDAIRNAKRDKEKLKDAARRYRKRDPDSYREYVRARDSRNRENPSQVYVAKVLRLKSVHELTPDLYELKREQILLKRLAKQMNQAAQQENDDEAITKHP